MIDAAARSALRRCARLGIAAALMAALWAPMAGARARHSDTFAARESDEVRALWVVRTTLTSPAAVASMVSAARASGFNTLLVQVRGRGDAFYDSALEPRAAVLASQPRFDPLATTIQLAHDAGLAVHAWVNVNLVAGVNELPASRDHVVYRHPEWLMVPRALAGDFATLDPHSPEYLGRLARYVRGQPAELEGLYVSPILDEAAEYTTSVVQNIARQYPVDGVHLDYIRYPDEAFDYSASALAAFRADVVRDLTPTDRARYDKRVAGEPAIYAQAFPERWRQFRMARLTALVSRVRDGVKSVRPSAVVSVAVKPDPVRAAADRLQDWRLWLDRNLVDVVCPMAYTTDASRFAADIATARAAAGERRMWAGIGAYLLSPDQIIDNVQTARRLGAGGIILFSYDSLTGPAHAPDYLAQVGRAAFASSSSSQF